MPVTVGATVPDPATTPSATTISTHTGLTPPRPMHRPTQRPMQRPTHPVRATTGPSRSAPAWPAAARAASAKAAPGDPVARAPTAARRRGVGLADGSPIAQPYVVAALDLVELAPPPWILERFDGLGVLWAWVVVARPVGSTAPVFERLFNPARPSDGGPRDREETPGALFFVDGAGDFQIQLRVTLDEAPEPIVAMTVHISALAYRGLRVQLSWEDRKFKRPSPPPKSSLRVAPCATFLDPEPRATAASRATTAAVRWSRATRTRTRGAWTAPTTTGTGTSTATTSTAPGALSVATRRAQLGVKTLNFSTYSVVVRWQHHPLTSFRHRCLSVRVSS